MTTVTLNDLTVTLTQEAYISCNIDYAELVLNDDGSYNGGIWESHAEDAEGNEYMVYWNFTASDEQPDASNYDWDNPWKIVRL